jgi:hypothetical protein
MRQSRVNAKWALGTLALALALPVIAQEAPESLLPPGFGEAPEAPPSSGPQPARPTGPASPMPMIQPLPPSVEAPADNAVMNAADEALSEEELAAQKQKYDLPEDAHRSLDRVGPLKPEQLGFGPDAFGGRSGLFLATLMKETRAPITSRWASILLRRALLSATDTPRDINGADWVAERAWLLLRMGEADSARLLVQSVDSDQFTPRLYAVAMQTYLATADPAGLCPLSAGALRYSKEPGWDMTRAICPALSGDQGSKSGAAARGGSRHRLSTCGEGRRHRLQCPAVGEDRMGRGRSADSMALWLGDRPQHRNPRAALRDRRSACTGVGGARACVERGSPLAGG